jgi:hypothetical protein
MLDKKKRRLSGTNGTIEREPAYERDKEESEEL